MFTCNELCEDIGYTCVGQYTHPDCYVTGASSSCGRREGSHTCTCRRVPPGYALYSGRACRGRNELTTTGVSLQACADSCTAEQSCISFEHSTSHPNGQDNVCQRSTSCVNDLSQATSDGGFSLYVKVPPAGDASLPTPNHAVTTARPIEGGGTVGSAEPARCALGEYSNAQAVCTKCTPGTYNSNAGSSATRCTPCPPGTVSPAGSVSANACFSRFLLGPAGSDTFCTGQADNDRRSERSLIDTAADCRLFANTSSSHTFNATNEPCVQNHTDCSLVVTANCGTTLPGGFDVDANCPVLCGLCAIPQTRCVIASDGVTVRYFDPGTFSAQPVQYLESSYTPVCTAYFCDRYGYAIERPATNTTPPVCSNEAALAEARETEAATYRDFYLAALLLVIFIEIAGLYVVTKTADELGWPQAILVLIFGIRSFDMFSDWAFYAISLKKGGSFSLLYVDEGGDFDAVSSAALAFSVFGTLLYIPDLYGFYSRVNPKADEKAAKKAATVTALVFVFEDFPQLMINSIYLDTVGFDEADNIAIFAFTMSMMSLVLNCALFWDEVVGESRVAAKANPAAAARRQSARAQRQHENPAYRTPAPPSYESSTGTKDSFGF